MADRQIIDPRTGRPFTATVPPDAEIQPRYMVPEGVPPIDLGAPPQAGPPSSPQGTGGVLWTFGHDPERGRNQPRTLWTYGPGAEGGRETGGTAPVGPPTDFGLSAELPSYMQDYMAQVEGIMGGLSGTGTAGAAPRLPEAPTRDVNPALQSNVDYQTGRQKQVQGMLDERRQRLEEHNPENTSRLMRIGQYLSALAADGRLENAGAIMSQLQSAREEDIARFHDRLDELTMAGWSAEDAVHQSMVELQSGQYDTTNLNADRADERGVQQAGMDSQYQLFNAGQEGQNARAGMGLGADLAGQIMQMHADRNERRLQGLQGLLSDPAYGAQAGDAIGNDFFGDPNAAHVLGQGLAGEAEARQIMGMIQAFGGDKQQLRRYIRQLNPQVTSGQIERAHGNPAALLLLARPELQRHLPSLMTPAQ